MPKPSKLWSSWLTLVLGGVATSLIQLIGFFIIPRIYSPESFGLYSLILSLSLILTPYSTGRYELEITNFKNSLELKLLVAQVIRRLAICVIFLFFVVEIFLFFGSEYVEFSDLRILRFLVPFVFLNGLLSIGIQISIRRKAFRFLSSRNLFQYAMVIFLQILLGIFLTPNVYILLFSELLAKAFAILLFARSIFISPKSAVTFTLLVLENRIKRTFFSKLLIANIFDSLSVNLFVIVFSLFFNSEITGHVALALKFVLLPITIVGYSLGQVLLGHWSGRGIENSQVFKAELIALPRKLAILSASITICFLALYTLVPWDLLPPDWNKSPEFILFLIPYMLGAMIWNPYSITAILFARYSDLAHVSVWRFALLFFTIAICLIFALSASILLIATSAASLLIDLYYVNKWNSYFKNNI